MPSYHDDNFGFWGDTHDPEVIEFYLKTQMESVQKRCSMCGRSVRIKPKYDKCNRCTDMIEKGFDEW